MKNQSSFQASFQLNILLIDSKDTLLPKHQIEAWDWDADKQDDFIGDATTDTKGRCTIRLRSDRYNEKEDWSPEIYLKVYTGNMLIYNTRSLLLYSLEDFEESTGEQVLDIVVRVPDHSRYSLPEIPVELADYHRAIGELQQTVRQKQFIETKLNTVLSNRIKALLNLKSEESRKIFSNINWSIWERRNWKLDQLIREVVLPVLTKPEDANDPLSTLERKKLDQSLEDLLRLNTSFATHPWFSTEAKQFHNFSLLRMVDEEVAKSIHREGGLPPGPGLSDWKQLLEEKRITAEQVPALETVFELSEITHAYLTLVLVIWKDQRIQQPSDLLALEHMDWIGMIHEAGLPAPVSNLEEFLQEVKERLNRLFPTESVFKGIKVNKERIQEQVEQIEKLLEAEEDVFSGEEPDWNKIPRRQQAAAKKAHKELKQLSRQYRHLSIGEILHKDKSAEEKGKEIRRAIERVNTFKKNNPDLDLFKADFIKNPDEKDNPLDWTGIAKDAKPAVRQQLLAFQRTASLSPDPKITEKMMQAGIDSAFWVVSKGKDALQKEAGLNQKEVEIIYNVAQQQATRTANQAMALLELLQNEQLRLTPDNTIAHPNKGFSGFCDDPHQHQVPLIQEVRNELKDIDGFSDLFGPQNFCQCDHCNSIFSPAAYLMDLLAFIDKNITEYSKSANEGEDANLSVLERHPCNRDNNFPLWLENRRGDIFDLDLSCENTFQLVPYLQIVNEVKENYIQKVWQRDGTIVNSAIDIYEQLFSDQNKWTFFAAPTSLAFSEIKILLDHFKLDLAKISEVLRLDDARQAYARLGILKKELNNSHSVFKFFGDRSPFQIMDVTEFLKHTGLARKELSELVATNYIMPNPQDANRIKIEKIPFDPGIQYVGEELINIDAYKLRRIIYFLKLWKHTDWSIAKLDLVLLVIQELRGGVSNSNNPFDETEVILLSKILKLQQQLKLSVEEVIGLIHSLPNQSLKTIERKDRLTGELISEKEPGYLSRQFSIDKIWGNQSQVNLDPETDDSFEYVLAGVKLSRGHFDILKAAGKVSSPLSIAQNQFSDLSLLFRHQVLMTNLKLSPEEYLIAWDLSGIDLATSSTNIVADLLVFIEFVRYWNSSRWSWKELHRLITNEFEINDEEKTTLLFNTENQKRFNSDIFINLLGADETPLLTAEEISELLETMRAAGLAVEENDSWILNTNFDANTFHGLINNLSIDVHENVLYEFFQPYHPLRIERFGFFTADELVSQTDFDTAQINRLLHDLLDDGLLVATSDGQHIQVPATSIDLSGWLSAEIDQLNLAATNDPDTFTSKDENRLSVFSALQAGHKQLEEAIGSIDARGEALYNDLWRSLTSFESSLIDSVQRFLTKNYRGLLDQLLVPGSFELEDFIRDVKRIQLLIKKTQLDHGSIEFIANLTSPDPLQISLHHLRAFLDYQTWVQLDPEAEKTILRPALKGISIQSYDVVAMAFEHYFEWPAYATQTVLQNFTSQTDVFTTLNQLKDRVDLTLTLDIRANQLSLFNNLNYQHDYSQAEKLVHLLRSSFERQFVDKESFQRSFEPYKEKILEARRDLLCQYLLAYKELNFKDINDLYTYFLLDPEMSGCMKTSPIVAAHTSLQLYVQRVMMNLEQSDGGGFHAYLHPAASQEWAWRKNYRVWEANRKVFVYPESYIHSALRPDKSPEFKELEEELLQQQISLESAEAAYKEYFNKVYKLGKLIISGAYYEKKNGRNIFQNQYHFLAVPQPIPMNIIGGFIIRKQTDGPPGKKSSWALTVRMFLRFVIWGSYICFG